ncbi:hypothetical protein [Conchiformibius kuhniae]|uniref:Uncharacterized protein n=1 Tax=Conchiformibius kuhniae TaxID=211502 RepID=A0A8T9MX86_9NEIS|nr:hypothetical protein [Conchiformibius kuhniae]
MSAVAALLLPALALALELYLHRNGLPVIWRRNTLAWSLLWLLPAAFAGGLWLLHDVESGTGFFATYVFAKIWLCAYVPYLHRAAARFKLPDTLGRHMRCCALAAVAGLLPLLCALTALADTFAAPVLHLLLAAFGGYTAWRLLEHAERPDHARTERQARTLLHRWFPVWPQLHGRKLWLAPAALRQARRDFPDVCPTRARHPLPNAPTLTILASCSAAAAWTGAWLLLQALPAAWAFSGQFAPVCSALLCALLGTHTLYARPEAVQQYGTAWEKPLVVLLFFACFKLLLNLSDRLFEHGSAIDRRAALAVVLLVSAAGIGNVLYRARRAPAQD